MWDLVKDNGWPSRGRLGAVTAGKLLAAKRPDLIPIYDSLIDKAIKGPTHKYWEAWRKLYVSPKGGELRQCAAKAQEDVPMAQHLGILRVVDIVIWHWAHNHPDELVIHRAEEAQ